MLVRHDPADEAQRSGFFGAKGASQFLTKQFQVGVVGYVYRELGCDSGSGDRVGCF
jgi:hypothetical protein